MSPSMVRRTSIAIIAEILGLLRLGETGRIEIMYTVRLNNQMLPKYLEWLLKSGLATEVKREHEIVNYLITRKGLDLLSKIEDLREMLHANDSLEIFKRPELTEEIARNAPARKSSKAR